jgi:hypothetical protein
MKYGPTRKEHLFRLVFSLGGLALMAVGLAIRGLPEGPGLIEVVGLTTLFFGGTAILSLRALFRK